MPLKSCVWYNCTQKEKRVGSYDDLNCVTHSHLINYSINCNVKPKMEFAFAASR